MSDDARARGLGLCSRCHVRKASLRLDYARMSLCDECFVKFVERKVERTLEEYKMIERGDKLLLALSGGKDSSALLHIIKSLAPDVKLTCLHIDLGVEGFSEQCRSKAEELAGQEGVELEVVELRSFLGCTMSELASRRRKACSPCGLARRYILNYYGNLWGATKIATGHNLDDVLAVLWDLYVAGDLLQAVRLQPVTKHAHPKALSRIKPLIELTDFELKAYADIKALPYSPAQCPLGRESKLNKRKKLIDAIESMRPSFKHTFFKTHVKRVSPLLGPLLMARATDWRSCAKCGMPSKGEVCGMCRLKEDLKKG
ncbi:MAG: hypothetical protein HA491_01830 [Candidatus Verstraetearchaeota archaeon]|jgi:uncharacterized protein (TIGR00269 family)|nr:hypothetical protein [Candidatus Verstraetearchaeota archaeon]